MRGPGGTLRIHATLAGPLKIGFRRPCEHLGFGDFEVSNGWLYRWKKRHNIKQMTDSCESGDMSGTTLILGKEG